jgi:hypothetical protein
MNKKYRIAPKFSANISNSKIVNENDTNKTMTAISIIHFVAGLNIKYHTIRTKTNPINGDIMILRKGT